MDTMRVAAALTIILFLGCQASAQLTANYNVVLEENGNALVTIVVSGIGTINVPLPLDVKSPAVRDALYVKAKNGVEVSIDAGGQSTIVYKTALLSSRDGADWRFRMELPQFEAATIIMYVPENTVVSTTHPNAAISHVGTSKSIIWNVEPSKEPVVEAHYGFTQAPIQAPIAGGLSWILWLLAAAASVAVIGGLYLGLKRRAQGRVVLSPGKQNVLKTLTGNETKIVNILLQNSGGLRRNDLEKTSGIAKSSLASCLHNLEQRNIVHVDKSLSVHYVELTEWFKSL